MNKNLYNFISKSTNVFSSFLFILCFLAHTEAGGNIEIEKSKIEEKEWMFEGTAFIKSKVSAWNKSTFSIRQYEKSLFIKMPFDASRRIDIVSMNGKTLNSKLSSSNFTSIDIRTISSGTYIITIFDSNSKLFSKQFSIK